MDREDRHPKLSMLRRDFLEPQITVDKVFLLTLSLSDPVSASSVDLSVAFF